MAPPKQLPLSATMAQTLPASPRSLSPVGDVIFIHNPSDNAPISGGVGMPIGTAGSNGTGPR
jgi:hypothetical protein